MLKPGHRIRSTLSRLFLNDECLLPDVHNAIPFLYAVIDNLQIKTMTFRQIK